MSCSLKCFCEGSRNRLRGSQRLNRAGITNCPFKVLKLIPIRRVFFENPTKQRSSSLIARLTKARRDSGWHLERDGAWVHGDISRDRNTPSRVRTTTSLRPDNFSLTQLLSSVAIELMIAHAATTHPSPPRRIFTGEARKHKSCWPQIEL